MVPRPLSLLQWTEETAMSAQIWTCERFATEQAKRGADLELVAIIADVLAGNRDDLPVATMVLTRLERKGIADA
jgi:hypothetical protein